MMGREQILQLLFDHRIASVASIASVSRKRSGHHFGGCLVCLAEAKEM